jgi:tRNA nucleotidyltransferase (CCA-adding enzyme)
MHGRDDISRLLVEEVAIAHVESVFDAIAGLESTVDGVYLVGGAVRDVLLGAESFDIDIVVEGDGIAFAHSLAQLLGARVTPHAKFGTAIVHHGRDARVDVVTARSERYHAPAVLPTVERATIVEDLGRRDFTINAMAVSLRSRDFGQLVDPFHGREDLEHGVIRVLHTASFVDDPTRIFRAVRYEARFDFHLDADSERLVRASVAGGHLDDLTPARLTAELEALFDEPGAVRGIARLGELGVDRALHPRLRMDPEGAELFARAHRLADAYGLGVPSWRIGLEVVARELSAAEIRDWVRRLELRRRDADLVIGAVAGAAGMAERLREAPLSCAEIVDVASVSDPDAALLALATTDERALRDYFQRLRGLRLEIGGRELAELGLAESPRVGEILAEIRRRKLNGELDGRDAELAAARELVSA